MDISASAAFPQGWYASANRQTFEQLCHCILSDVQLPSGQYPAFYVTPGVVSAGPNGKYASAAGVTYKTALNGLGLVPGFSLGAYNSNAGINAKPVYVNNSGPCPTCMSLDVTNPAYATGQHNFDVDDNISNFLLKLGGTGN